MALGRGSASNGAVVLGAAVLLVAFLLVSGGPALTEAAKYTVGDYGGWKFNVAGWAKGKTFRAGDVLEFKYNGAVHDVAAVDATAYRSCVLPKGKKTLRSGHDKVKLVKGTHYFICTVPGHCQANMKIAVRVI
uniref:Uncharacterized protein n=1 Tax=Avena sativa TaxID=4498 RepID=A0ACD5ZJI7_AVESA